MKNFKSIGKRFLVFTFVFALLLASSCGKKESGEQSGKSSEISITGKIDDYLSDDGTGEDGLTTEEKEPLFVPKVIDISFAACGDDLIHSGIFNWAKNVSADGTYDFSFCYAKTKDFFQAHDLCFINQETLVNDQFTPSGYPCFSTPAEIGSALYDANFRVFNLSTNHTYDLGGDGLAATLEFWDSMPDDVLYPGLWKKDDLDYIPIYNYEDIKIAFLSYTYGTNGFATPDNSETRVIYLDEEDVIKRQLMLANEQADMVIVSAHWGIEDSHIVSDDQKHQAQFLAENGADLIIGTHPHVAQTAEFINTSDGRKVFCMYSLGNFVSTQLKTSELVGLVFDCNLVFTEQPDGTFVGEVRNPVLIPELTVYDANRTNSHAEFLKDTTPEQLNSSYMRAIDGTYSNDAVYYILQNYVDSRYLWMPGEDRPVTTPTPTDASPTDSN